ncbi:MAG TPA: 2-isopropylmalate synthase [Symbiobacteriaceae bacterium]|nr:2-isopropylmalate synthase [Symbiobacteriaceae bacterium]
MTRRVQVFDTTLRDGEQSPGFGLTAEQKLEVAAQIARLGADVIEAGFPIASPGDFAGVKRIAEGVRGPVIAAMARANRADIEAVAQALGGAERRRVHIVLATSPIHIQHKLRKSPAEVVALARESVSYARSLGLEVEFCAEDATRSDWAFLTQILTVAARAGATVLNVPDTVGVATPQEYGDLFRHLIAHVDVPEGVIFSAHCHNDLGLAVANTLAALEAGALQVECTVNGIGERAGNAALEELAMALQIRGDRLRFQTGIQSREIYKTSRLLQSLTGVSVQPNKAIVGANAFAHEAGIHQDGILKHRATYEIIRPEDVGVPAHALVLGKHSGRHALRARLEQMGYQLDEAAFDRAFNRFKEVADRKKSVSDLDLEAIVCDEQASRSVAEVFRVESYQVTSGNRALPMAVVQLVHADGNVRQEAASGDGPVDALYHAIDRAARFDGELREYWSKAVTSGGDALVEVSVLVQREQRVASGRAASTDVIEASARAYLTAINKILSGAAVAVSDEPAPHWQMRAWGD